MRNGKIDADFLLFQKSFDAMKGSKVVILAFCLLWVIVDCKKNGFNRNSVSCHVCDGKLYCGKPKPRYCDEERRCTAFEHRRCQDLQPSTSDVCNDVGPMNASSDDKGFFECIINEHTGTIDKVYRRCYDKSKFVDAVGKCLNETEISSLKELEKMKHRTKPFICKKSGLLADYMSCRNYYYCQEEGVKSEKRLCPDGKFYNADNQSCTKHLSVECAGKLSRKYVEQKMNQRLLLWELKQFMLNAKDYQSVSSMDSRQEKNKRIFFGDSLDKWSMGDFEYDYPDNDYADDTEYFSSKKKKTFSHEAFDSPALRRNPGNPMRLFRSSTDTKMCSVPCRALALLGNGMMKE